MKIFSFEITFPGFGEISGVRELDRQMQKFRDLRDSYHEANREYYGEYFAALMDGK